jgi:SAM-dependent methyltransferase
MSGGVIQPTLPRLYADLSDWWPALSRVEDYEEEAGFFRQALLSTAPGAPRTLLELGSGGGSNAFFLKQTFQMTLVDLSPGMLSVSRKVNPELEHLQGDMRTVRLDRTFDAVFIHDAIMYMTTEEDLRQAFATAYAHCKPGGVALFVPDCVAETFSPASEHGGHDLADRGMRYLAWDWDPDPDDSSYLVDFAYLLREPDGQVRCEYDRHVVGLFKREDWLRYIQETGFEPGNRTFRHSESGALEVFTGIKSSEGK